MSHAKESTGLMRKYMQSFSFCLKVKPLFALPHLESRDAPGVFAVLKDSFEPDEAALANYFEKTYIGQPGRNGRRNVPQFPIELWTARA